MRNFKYNIKYYLASIILISNLVILPSCRNITEGGLFRRRSLKKALLWAQQDSIRVADSLKRNLIVNGYVVEALEDSIIPTEEEILIGDGIMNHYYIIVGTFAEPENAKLLAEQFRNQGYETSIISRANRYGNKLNMVSIKSFNEVEMALSFLNEYQSKVESSAWLYQNK